MQSVVGLDARQQAPHVGPLHLGGLDVVIVDFDEAPAADVLALLRARPDLKIVGVNAATGVLTVFAGQVCPAHKLEDVIAHLEQLLPLRR